MVLSKATKKRREAKKLKILGKNIPVKKTSNPWNGK